MDASGGNTGRRYPKEIHVHGHIIVALLHQDASYGSRYTSTVCEFLNVDIIKQVDDHKQLASL